MSGGTHVRAVLLRDKEAPSVTAVQITVWPLPDDPELHDAVYKVARDAVNTELTKRKITAGTMTDLTAKGPIQ